jgi:transketolase
MSLSFGPRRGIYVDIEQELQSGRPPLSDRDVVSFETLDLIYRSLCALMYNYVPMSGHPGGSISSGRFVSSLLFETMDYDLSAPDRPDADIVSYAAGHKALGLYAMWALRNEVARIGDAKLLAASEAMQLRLEDLLGFRRNPTASTPLFRKMRAKPLDGHPTPATPFVRLSTGASGVGVPASLGLAFGAIDTYGTENAPVVHIVEGEGGMTPGRVGEAMAAAGTASLSNAVMHIDWNQASIDSNQVCREDDRPGDYVQWTPMEFAYLHDWNVIYVRDGRDFQQIVAAQRRATDIDNGQPTAVVYHTTKGWMYGIEGRASHGAGHKLCTDPFFEAVEPLLEFTERELPRCEEDCQRCAGGANEDVIEECYWQALGVVRDALEHHSEMVGAMAQRLADARGRLDGRRRAPRDGAPNPSAVFAAAAQTSATPDELTLTPGKSTTLRAELGRVLGHFNKLGGGPVFAAAADLLDSTSVSKAAAGFPEGYFNTRSNPGARTLSIGGICEDAMIGICSGLAAYGRHIPAGSSYGAFIAPLGHIAARLHAIGNQSRRAIAAGEPYKPFFLICAHAGVKTGEDGPTHADPQALQLLEENFPAGTMVTLTPWDPQEMWPLVSTALAKRPAVIAPFVTRPNETVIDRDALELAPASEARTGVYRLRAARGEGDGTLVLQGSEVAYAFVQETMAMLDEEGVDLNVYYVASAELFDMLPAAERERVFPAALAAEAMGITGFTMPTMYRWVTSERGRALSLHPFAGGHFLGSGKAHKVLEEAGIDGPGQLRAIMRYVRER